MTLFDGVAQHWQSVVVFGLIATAAMSTALEGAQLLGFSRMSLPFLFGAFVTGDRHRAIVLGYVLYLFGGWLFALAYALALQGLGTSTWWVGAVIGFCHGAFLVAVLLPLLPYIHPRLASEYDGPSALRRLEPPGPFGLNYGRATPATTILSQTIYGLVFALGYSVS